MALHTIKTNKTKTTKTNLRQKLKYIKKEQKNLIKKKKKKKETLRKLVLKQAWSLKP